MIKIIHLSDWHIQEELGEKKMIAKKSSIQLVIRSKKMTKSTVELSKVVYPAYHSYSDFSACYLP